jgi:hypothetical protein
MAVKVKFYERPANIEEALRLKIEAFLERYIPEGTVLMGPDVYRSANMWSVAYGEQNSVLGFAAHRVVSLPGCRVVQIMATFLAPELRGTIFSSLLLQGQIFFKTWLGAPLTPIYWCTRTRIPAAYAAARRANEILPDLADPEKNRKNAIFARCLAAYVYGDHISLEPDTFVLRGSYPSGSKFVFLHQERKKNSRFRQYFDRCLDYQQNEAIFVMGQLRKVGLVKFLTLIYLHRAAGLVGHMQFFRHFGIGYS